MPHYLDFEQPIAELEGKIEELRHLTGEHGLNIAEEVGKLQAKVDRQLRAVYGKLTAWQKVQVARHPDRPHFTDVVGRLVTEFTPLAGDRLYGEDAAIVGGLGRLEGGSGGAIAIAAANRVIMLEHAVYSVISPEGCASILWRSAEQAKDAAEALKLTAQDLLKLGVIDVVVPEPMGGAHRDRDSAIDALGAAIRREIDSLADDEPAALRARRREKYLEMGRNGVA
jgi:acetyl-CoA carboxylase alpha subunit